jgi:hypothetical protein
MTAFAHWTAMHAWWIARRTERDAIGKPWAARKIAPETPPTTSNTVAASPAEPPNMIEPGAQSSPTQTTATAPGTEPAIPVADGGTSDLDAPPAHPRQRAPARRSKRAYPDEGGPVTDADVETMKKAYAALPAKASAWATRIMVQGNDAPLPWNKLSVTKTVRRYELYRGVRQVAAYAFADDCDCDSNADEVVRAIVHAVTFDDAALFPTVPPGMVLASLDYLEAIKFSEVAHDLVTNRYSLLADSTGVLRLAPVA